MRLPTISLSSLPPSPRHFFFFPHIPQYSKNNFRNCWLEKCVKYIMSINGFINTMFFFFYFVACSSFTIFNFVIIIWLHHVVEAAINPTIDLPEITQDWGNRLLEGTHRTLCTTGPRRKEQWPHKRLIQTCLWVSMSLQWRHGSVVACCRIGGPDCSSSGLGHFERGHHYLHYYDHSLASGK